jgi:hypothetical protein
LLQVNDVKIDDLEDSGRHQHFPDVVLLAFGLQQFENVLGAQNPNVLTCTPEILNQDDEIICDFFVAVVQLVVHILHRLFHPRRLLDMVQEDKLHMLELLLRVRELVFDVELKDPFCVVLDPAHAAIL